jgi:hypothetical protein
MVIWHDVMADAEVDYNEWHSKEHMLERVGVPGFRRGHRYVAITGAPRYLNFYEVDDLAILTSTPYLERLNHPTPWSQRALPGMRHNNRTLCRVAASFGGGGVCAFLLTIQLAAAERAEELRGRLTSRALAELPSRPGIVGAHLLQGDLAASRTETEEKRLRGTPDAIAGWVILVAGYDGDALQAIRDGELADRELLAHGADRPIAGVYRLLHSIAEPDLGS